MSGTRLKRFGLTCLKEKLGLTVRCTGWGRDSWVMSKARKPTKCLDCSVVVPRGVMMWRLVDYWNPPSAMRICQGCVKRKG